MTGETPNADLVIADDHALALGPVIAGRAAPVVTPESERFWDGLAHGEIVLSRCRACGRLSYIAVPGCPRCGSADVVAEAVDGRGTLYTFTVCYVEYGPGLETPYVVGVVSPECDPDVRIVTNLVGCRVRDVRIGAAVVPEIVATEFGHLLFYRPEASEQ